MRILVAALIALSAPLALSDALANTSPGTGTDSSVPKQAFVHAAGSMLGFASSYDGEAFEGRFARFTTAITFDPASASGRFDVSIDLSSANTENEERDEVLHGKDFFNVVALPQARYEATRFRRLTDGRFVAEGSLHLRGVVQPVPLTFTWTPGASPVLEGSALVPRLVFQVGTGDWADLDLMPDAVSVTTRLVLQAKP